VSSHIPLVVTLGESMIRYSPKGFARLEQVQELEMRVAGAESNVAIACARLGLRAVWISKLTDNALGRFLERSIAHHGVDTSNVVWTNQHRVGTYYIEFGSPPRPTRVLYDRAHSAFSHMDVGEVKWKAIRQADLFHLTGITPALSPSCEKVAIQAMHEAKEAGAWVSFDVNYRSKLWSSVAAARARLGECLGLADIAFISNQEAEIIFGLTGSDEDVLREVRQLCPHTVVLKRPDGAVALHENAVYRAGVYETQTVDPIGTGDAFAAGFIFGLLTSGMVRPKAPAQKEKLQALQRALEYAAGLAALKRTIPGDVAAISRSELEELFHGHGSRIQR